MISYLKKRNPLNINGCNQTARLNQKPWFGFAVCGKSGGIDGGKSVVLF